ncbi:Rieske 2Fe-2S domain-containing protein [Rhodococcus hoagii]|nr:Rieske 2Fe-2S domain-containing protein [Prescottella equi]
MTTDATDVPQTEEVRMIEAAAAPTRFARGWHCLGLIRDFKDGKPHSIEAFGTSWSCSPTARASSMSSTRTCRPHGRRPEPGRDQGATIACPFHDWRWNGKGKCTDIPYARRVPPGRQDPRVDHARAQRPAVRLERPAGQPAAGRRHDPRDRGSTAPTSGPTGPGTRSASRVHTVGRSSTTSSTWRTSSTSTTPSPKYFKNVFEGHIATQYMRSRRAATSCSAPTTTGTRTPKGVRSILFRSFVHDRLARERLRRTHDEGSSSTATTPVTDNSFVLQYGVIVEKIPDCPTRKPPPWPPRSSPRASKSDSSRTSRSGRKRRPSTTRCCRRRTDRSTSCAAGTAVLRRCRRHHGRHDQALRVRDRHHTSGRELEEGSRREHRAAYRQRRRVERHSRRDLKT